MAKPREILVALFLSFVSGTILGLAVTTDRLGDIPIEVRPHVGAALAAVCADELRFDIRKPRIIASDRP
jgi:hypothetical protein